MVVAEEGWHLKYKVTFDMQELARGNTTLLGTPMFGDITFFYSEEITAPSYLATSD